MNKTKKQFKPKRCLNFGNVHEAESRGALEQVMIPQDQTMIAAHVRDANVFGYDGLLSAGIPIDPYFPSVVASQVPSRLTLDDGIAVTLDRSLVLTANSAWELQCMRGGRFMLGLGSRVKAHITRRFGMPSSGQAERIGDTFRLSKHP